MKNWISKIIILAVLSPLAGAAETKSSFWMTSTETHVRTQVTTSAGAKLRFDDRAVLKKFSSMIELVLGRQVMVQKTGSSVTVTNSKGDSFQFHISREAGGWKIDSFLKTQVRLGAETLMGITRLMRVQNEELAHAGLGVSRELGNS